MLSHALVADIDHAVNTAFKFCPSAYYGVACTHNYVPAMAGDCKQVAAEKLRRLLLAGARPGDFTLWIVQLPGVRHAVLVENATGLVLDNYVPQIEPRRLKEQHEGMVFLYPCGACMMPAYEAVARVRPGVFTRAD